MNRDKTLPIKDSKLLFIKFLLNNKKITRFQRSQISKLMEKDYDEVVEIVGKNSVRDIPVLTTATFFSKFNDPMGLKYLTHDFDPIEDGRPHTMKDIIVQCSNVMKDKNLNIPKSLWTLVFGFINGNVWKDTYGVEHTKNIRSKEWNDWTLESKKHPIQNPDFEPEIQLFRRTVRLVEKQLPEMIDKILSGKSLKVECTKLERADFYTNTYILYIVLDKIISQMNRRYADYPNVLIEYKKDKDKEGNRVRKIIITQKDSFATKDLDEAIQRLKINLDAGDFGSIRKLLNGYCYWSVETKWNEKPYRWNILKDNDTPEQEDISSNEAEGFRHILTFYIV